MTLLPRICICRIVSAVVMAGLLVAPVRAAGFIEVTEVQKFSGTATDITIQREPGGHGQVEFRIRGVFDPGVDIDLSNSFLLIDEMFVEDGAGGAGELITARDDQSLFPGFMVDARRSGIARHAVYETSGSFRPHMRLMIRKRGHQYEFRFKLDRGLARKGPNLCVDVPGSRRQMTDMTHSFTIVSLDGSDPDVAVTTTQPWECMKPTDFNMRSRPKPQTGGDANGDSGKNKAPQAAIREHVDQSSSSCCQVTLDGSRSQDREGPIASYLFGLTDKETGENIPGFPLLPQSTPLVVLQLPPGEYVASLDVVDDHGVKSERPATRRVSVREQ